MISKKLILKIVYILFIIVVLINVFQLFNSKFYSSSANVNSNINEKRGTPPYGWAKGKDRLPHMRVFFWVPKKTTHFAPFANDGIKTNVSTHGPISNWAVRETGKTSGNEKLVYVYVPKTFVFLHGKYFYKLIHLYYN